LALIAGDKFIAIPVMAEKLGISTTAVEKNLKKLKEKGAIARVGAARGGAWRING
jgi:ATP-dependent DNA helicase RecG